MNTQTAVVVALSGGVDSSATAALLLEHGYDVKGLMLRLWDGDPNIQEGEKRIQDSISRAQKVAQQLGIVFDVIDAREKFKNSIVEYYLQSHRNGQTPNPCFVCNKKIKWGLLLDEAIKSGAEYLATGHYARLVRNNEGIVELYRASDQQKDQSYVLAGLTQLQLSRALLPLGELTKVEARQIARRHGFKNYDQPDSQDLCFLGGLDQETFLSIYASEGQKEGEIRNLKGDVVGTHQGLSNYTIGQRKGLGSGFKEPVYVLKKEVETNSLIIGTKENLGIKAISITDENWISGFQPETPKAYEIKIRYKAIPVTGILAFDHKLGFTITFENKVRDATPGQYAVIYEQDKIIGSGMIQTTFGDAL